MQLLLVAAIVVGVCCVASARQYGALSKLAAFFCRHLWRTSTKGAHARASAFATCNRVPGYLMFMGCFARMGSADEDSNVNRKCRLTSDAITNAEALIAYDIHVVKVH